MCKRPNERETERVSKQANHSLSIPESQKPGELASVAKRVEVISLVNANDAGTSKTVSLFLFFSLSLSLESRI